MTTAEDVRNAFEQLNLDPEAMALKDDIAFVATVAQLYDEYLAENDDPNWDLATYTLDKIEFIYPT